MNEVSLKGWDADAKVWRKLVCNAAGKLIIDPSEIFEDPPTENETGKAPQSAWAFDHAADVAAHGTAFLSVYNYSNGHLVITDLSATSDRMFLLQILGNGYGAAQMINIQLQGYNYNTGDDMINLRAMAWELTTDIYVFCYGGFVCFWFDKTSPYQTFSLFCITPADYKAKNHITSITNVVKPTTGVTREHSITPLVLYSP